MISLVFIRHGEAESASEVISDHQRALTVNGKNKVSKVAARLKAANVSPDLILSSDAKRAAETCAIFEKVFSECSEVHYLKSFYDLDYDMLLEELAPYNGTDQYIFLIGHNPGWSEIVSLLTGLNVRLEPGEAYWCYYTKDESLQTALTEMGTWDLAQHIKG